MTTINNTYYNNVQMYNKKIKPIKNNTDNKDFKSKDVLLTTGLGALGGLILETEFNPASSAKTAGTSMAAGAILGFLLGVVVFIIAKYNKKHTIEKPAFNH